MSKLFEATPRWPGGPQICLHANLPTFADGNAAKAFQEANAPGATMERLWQCSKCKGWHYLSQDRGPSGSSSGTQRTMKHNFSNYGINE